MIELPSNETWLQGRRDFLKLLPQLRQTHLGHWVAVTKDQVVDAGEEETDLRRRVASAYPGQMIFISRVTDEALPPLRLPHVRVVP